MAGVSLLYARPGNIFFFGSSAKQWVPNTNTLILMFFFVAGFAQKHNLRNWLVVGGWLKVAGGWWLVAGGWWLVVGGWWLVAGGRWLVVGGWWLVFGGWWLAGWWLLAAGWWLVLGGW